MRSRRDKNDGKDSSKMDKGWSRTKGDRKASSYKRFIKRVKKKAEEIGRPLTLQEDKKLFQELAEEIGMYAGVAGA